MATTSLICASSAKRRETAGLRLFWESAGEVGQTGNDPNVEENRAAPRSSRLGDYPIGNETLCQILYIKYLKILIIYKSQRRKLKGFFTLRPCCSSVAFRTV